MMPAAEDLPEDLRPLVTIQAIRVEDDDGQRFEFDAQQVVNAVARIMGEPETQIGPDIVLTPPDLVMDLGHSGQIAVVARNVDVATAELTYDGPDWARLGPDIESRGGGRELRNSLTVSPPRRSDLPPRAWPYTIELRDQRRDVLLAQASGTLTTVAFRDTHVHLEPARIETRRSASLSLTVGNGGNVHLYGRVETKAEGLRAEGPDDITLRPGTEETYPVSVSAPTRRLFGRAIEHPMTVSVAVQGQRERHVRQVTIRQRPLLPAGVVLLVATILVALGGFGVWRAQQAEAKLLPDVVGMTESEAQEYLEKAGFNPDSIDSRRQDADESGNDVVRTVPEHGTTVSPGDRIQLFVGDGSSLLVVPNVVGKSQVDAAAALDAQGFKNIRPEVSETTAEEEIGKVIRTEPAAKVERRPEQEIVIFVGTAPAGGTETGGSAGGTEGETDAPNGSGGQTKYTIPPVIGSPWEEAAEDLDEAHFEASPKYEASDTVPEGSVIRTDPEEGTSHSADTNVTVYVSTGPEPPPLIMPSLIGSNGSAAEAAVAALELELSSDVEETCEMQEGLVAAQDPPAGAEVPSGATVTIWFAQPPPGGCG